jgi:hypothetical protein
MDYHFLRPQGVAPKTGFNSSNVFKLFTRFLPLFLLAAILPFLVGMVASPPDIGFLTRADIEPTLRVWLEPANIVLAPGSTTELAVVAQFEGEGEFIPEITLNITSQGGVAVQGSQIAHRIPFSGKAELGRLVVRGVEPGSASVNIDRDSVSITAYNTPIEIKTAGANVTVR